MTSPPSARHRDGDYIRLTYLLEDLPADGGGTAFIPGCAALPTLPTRPHRIVSQGMVACGARARLPPLPSGLL